jgi:hypothetical protein
LNGGWSVGPDPKSCLPFLISKGEKGGDRRLVKNLIIKMQKRKKKMKKGLELALLLLLLWTPTALGADLAGVEIHGFVSQGFLWSGDNNYLAADTADGSFEFNEVGINFNKSLDDRLRVGVQFFSRDLGRAGNNEPIIDWAMGDYRWKDWLGIRVGLIKLPHGLYSESRDQDMVRNSILLPQSVYPEMQRDYYTRMWGGGIYGNAYFDSVGNFSYKLLVGAYNPDPDRSGLAVEIEDGGFFGVESFNHGEGIQYSGGLVWDTPLEGLRVGATGWFMKGIGADLVILEDLFPGSESQVGSVANIDVDRWATVYSIEYTWQYLRVTAEYRLEHTDNKWSAGFEAFDSKVDSEGYYLGASYRFTDWLEIGSYYSELYPDKDDKDGDRYQGFGEDFQAWQKDFALTARFDINENWLVKLEGHAIDGAAGVLFANDNPNGFEKDDYLFAAKVTFNF